jgi:two-component system, NtrC family, sensor kinase
VTAFELTHLNPDSTLADLPCHDFEVPPSTAGHEVVGVLERYAELPGFIVRQDNQEPALVSRQMLFATLSRPFSREIYLKRPIQVLVEAVSHRALRLAADCRISEAARAAFAREQQAVYEPLIVSWPDGRFRILDVYALLQAQTVLLNLANRTIVQQEKLASLGQLSAGLAHEINNPIAYVSNNLNSLQRDSLAVLKLVQEYRAMRQRGVVGNGPVEELEEEIDLPYIEQNLPRLFEASLKGLHRVRDIVLNLRDFARLDEADFKEIDLMGSLDSTLEILHHELRLKEIEVVKRYNTVPGVLGHPGKINQVFLNLLVNAVQACGQAGRIEVGTTHHNMGVEVSIADNGCGIAAESLPRIFEPFFTTKPVGQGTGLGLSVSYGIVRDHGGRIEVQSTVGRGSRFSVCLPPRPPHSPRH